MKSLRIWGLCVALVGLSIAPVLAQAPPTTPAELLRSTPPEDHDPNHFMHDLDEALAALPLAAVLGAALALRARRRGTPPRQASVVQTQIILAVVGAMVMLIVGQSLARAFGIVGVASLIRYRAKVDDPKDAVVMLCSLGVGLASGVGLYGLAMLSTAFLLAVLFLLESFEPETKKLFDVTITSKADNIRKGVEAIFRRASIEYELRSMSEDEHVYEVRLPLRRRVDKISNAIAALDRSSETAVEWKEKKPKQSA